MTAARLVTPALVAVLLASATACSASSEPVASASATSGSGPAKTHRSANPEPVAGTMPDVIGGNAGGAYEQMSSKIDMVFKDASGQGRSVEDRSAWKICDSRPGPNQQITESPVVFYVVKVAETCKGATSN